VTLKLPEVTAAGWSELKPVGLKPPKPVIQGGWEHQLCEAVLEKLGRRQNYNVYFELPIGPLQNVRGDVMWQKKNGSIILWQCGFSSPEREADSIERITAIDSLDNWKVAVVCRDKAFHQAFIRDIKKRHIAQQMCDDIIVKIFGDLLECYYNRLKLKINV